MKFEPAWLRSFSAGNGADHVHGKLNSQDRQVDNSDAENYLNAQHRFALRLRNPPTPGSVPITRSDPARVRPNSAPDNSTPKRTDRNTEPTTRPECSLRAPLCSRRHTRAVRASHALRSQPHGLSWWSLNWSFAISA